MKDYKYLVANGCSFVQGSGLHGPLSNQPVKNVEGKVGAVKYSK